MSQRLTVTREAARNPSQIGKKVRESAQTEAMVAEKPEKKTPPAMPPGGGMDEF